MILLALAAGASADTLHVPADYVTIPEAIQAASDGDTIAIAAGTYIIDEADSPLEIMETSITVTGETNADGSIAVTIQCDASSSDSGLMVALGPMHTVTLEHLRVSGGGLGLVGGIHWIRNCIIEGSQWGVGIIDGDVSMTDCVVRDHHGTGVVGLYVFGDELEPHLMLENCVIEDNSAQYQPWWAATCGVFAWYGAVSMQDCTVRNNRAYTTSGAGASSGIIGMEFAGPFSFNNTTVCGNQVDDEPTDQVLGDWTDGGGNTITDECEDCTGDLDGNGQVTIDDLLSLLGFWGEGNVGGDVNNDGNTNVDDLLILIGAVGGCG